MSDEPKPIKIKPSLVPYVWKSVALVVVGLVVYVAVSAFPLPASVLLPNLVTLANYGALLLIALGVLGFLFGAVRRNTLTYLISDKDVVVQRQLLRRSVRRIPLSSISDIQVSQTLAGRLMGYGNIAPVTKSGYGLVRGMDRAENVVQEMINVPKPDKVADLIMSKVSVTSGTKASA